MIRIRFRNDPVVGFHGIFYCILIVRFFKLHCYGFKSKNKGYVTYNWPRIFFVTTKGYLQNIFSPNELIGDGHLIIPEENFFLDSRNGLFETVYFLLFYFLFIYAFFKFLKSNSDLKYFSFAILYIMLHSFKFPYHIINYPYVFFIIYISLKFLPIINDKIISKKNFS